MNGKGGQTPHSNVKIKWMALWLLSTFNSEFFIWKFYFKESHVFLPHVTYNLNRKRLKC